MRLSRATGLLTAASLCAVFALTGCGGGDAGNAADSVSVYTTEPENPLLPSDTNESGGSNAVNMIWTGLYTYDPNTGAPVPQMADSVTKTSPTSYDIKIKKGWKFHDGTEVKAKNYVDAWNYAAYLPNGQLTASYLAPIQGYTDVHPADIKAKPTKATMSGLKVVNDHEFTVTLAQPFSTFSLELGYNAFYPMPDQFFAAKDKTAWAKKPVGNGPMSFVSYQPSTAIKLSRNDSYLGSNKVKFKNVELRIYTTAEAGYQDLVSNNLDYDATMPPVALTNDQYKKDLPGRSSQKQVMNLDYLALPEYIPAYKDPNLRKAISLAIDRDEITKQIFHGARVPADGWVPPMIKGAEAGACGELCKFNPTLAKQYLAKSGFKGPITISSNADGGNKEWVDAACNSITKALGVQCRLDLQTSFGVFLQKTRAKQATGPYRSDWLADYPTVEDFLTQIYGTDGSSNHYDYSNPAFDKALITAGAAPDETTGSHLYSQAEKMLAGDMPVVPLWFYNNTCGWSTKLSKAEQSIFNLPEIPSFTPAAN